MGIAEMMIRAMVMAVVLASAVVAFDCDSLREPQRTSCLDRAAAEHVRMMPIHDHIKVSSAKDHASVIDDESIDDVMGDLGEASKTRAKMSAHAEMQADMKLAQQETDGMYDDDVKVARAFSDLDDEMDDLKTHLGQLHLNMHIANTEIHVRQEFDREEDMERAREEELGESDSPKRSTGVSMTQKDNGVLDASAADLDKELTVGFQHEDTEADTEDKVDSLMNKLRSISGEDKSVHMLEDSLEFVEFNNGQLDDGLTEDIVMQDLQSSGKSLIDRANMEMKQATDMDDEGDDETEATDLGEVEKQEHSAEESLDDLDKVFADKPSLNQDVEEEREEASQVVDQDELNKKPVSLSHGIGALDQDNAVKQAEAFASKEDEKEEDAIKQAQSREKDMEEKAKNKMYADMKTMNTEVTKEEHEIKSSMNKHSADEQQHTAN